MPDKQIQSNISHLSDSDRCEICSGFDVRPQTAEDPQSCAILTHVGPIMARSGHMLDPFKPQQSPMYYYYYYYYCYYDYYYYCCCCYYYYYYYYHY